ncbi:MAG: hypothetical protein L0Y35_04355 [Flammeovirgaceae bacterium]|nr:hypothetical protein [Flammeovirgaceae bacterium]
MEHHITIPFKARYFRSGDINQYTKEVWFVLHGYGQLASFFIKKFLVLSSQNICVIAPEGLSRFYHEDVQTRSRGGNNRVGASWMTREDRLTDIDNYLTFLNEVYHQELRDTSIPVSVLGFSQGAATATRWILDEKINFRRLILWAGIFPNDIDFSKGHHVLENKLVQLVYGTKDPFLTEERMKESAGLIKKLNINPNTLTFDGGHEIDETALLKLI